MRLSEVKFIIEQNVEELSIQVKDYPHDKNMMLVSNVKTTMNAIHNISHISFFQKDMRLLEQIQEIALIMVDNAVTVPRVKANQFFQLISRIKSECRIIVSLVSSLIPKMNDNTICIKLPDGNGELGITAKELSEISKSISFLFDTISLSEGRNERVEFVGVESGSSWMYYVVMGTVSLNIINLFLEKIFEIFKEILEYKEIQLKLKRKEIQCKILEDIAAYTNKLCENAIKQLEDDNHIHPDDETRGKYINAMGKCVKLLEMGTEIYPPISAPKEKQETASKYFKQIKSISKQLLLLESPETVLSEQDVNQHNDNLKRNEMKGEEEKPSSSD